MALSELIEIPRKRFETGMITQNRSTRMWYALMDSPYAAQAAVLTAVWATGLVPRPFIDTDPDNILALCRSVTGDQEREQPLAWLLSATYSSEPLISPPAIIPDPTARPAKIRWQTNSYRLAIERDINGRALINSAGEPFDPPVEVDRAHWHVLIQKNVFDVPGYILGYENATNDSLWIIDGIPIPKMAAKINAIEISEVQTEGDFDYRVFTYGVEIDPYYWKLEVLDRGLHQLVADGGGSLSFLGAPYVRKRIMTDDSVPQPVASPVLLDGTGHILEDLDNPVYLPFDGYLAVDYSVLPRF